VEGKTAEQIAKQQAQALTDMQDSPGWKILWAWYEKQLQALQAQQGNVDTLNDKDATSDVIARRLAWRQGFYVGSANMRDYFLGWLTEKLASGKVPGVETPGIDVTAGGE
jgi:hypothetical protein